MSPEVTLVFFFSPIIRILFETFLVYTLVILLIAHWLLSLIYKYTYSTQPEKSQTQTPILKYPKWNFQKGSPEPFYSNNLHEETS